MRRTNKIEFLKAIAKKDKILKSVLENVDNLTNNDIEKLSQPKWIRQSLIKIKENKIIEERLKPMQEKLKYSIYEIDPIAYKIYQYKGDTFYLPTKGLTIMIEYEDLILILPNNEIKINRDHVKIENNSFLILVM